MNTDILKILDEVSGEMLEKEKDKHPNTSQVLKIYEPKNQLTFKYSKFKSPIAIANAIIDLQNHIMVTSEVRLNDKILSKDEKKVLIKHLVELRDWIDTYLGDCIDFISSTLKNADDYANMSKDQLIEELKKYKGE